MKCSVRLTLLAFALGAAAIRGAGAQSQPAVAIVGAKIVDGSGNEPFVGTVLIEGDRIRAVGRSVEVPPGTATVDGKGRTLLPGLIDVLLTLDSAPSRAASAVAASLYSGVTTLGIAGLPDDQLDRLRAESGRADNGSRISAIGALAAGATVPADDQKVLAEWARVFRARPSAIFVAADSPGAEAVAADARSRGVRLFVDAARGGGAGAISLGPHLIVGIVQASEAAALVAQNVTVAPDLVAAAPAASIGRDKIAPELSALQPPAATEAAGEGDAGVWGSSTASVKALRDGRVRVAVASRKGTTHVPPGLSTHAATRLLVDAGLTPLQAVTAATSGGAWALGLQSDRGFLAPGMRADFVLVQGDPAANIADLGRVERVFLGGVDVERTKLLTRVLPPEAPAPTASAAPAPSAETAPTTAAASPPPTKAPPAGRSGRRRRGEAKVETPPPAPPLPAPSPEAAPGSSTPPPETPRATPPSGALPAPAAAPATVAVAAVKLNAPLIDDFEREDDRSVAGPAWSSASSEGATPATIVMGRVVRGLRDHALHLTARMGDGNAPFARASIPLVADGGPVDVSRFKGIRFDARGEGRYRVVFVTRSIVDGRYHESYFSGSPVWTPVGIPFASIGQNGKGSHASFTGKDLVEIRFEIARDPGRMGWLELDNIKFY